MACVIGLTRVNIILWLRLYSLGRFDYQLAALQSSPHGAVVTAR